MMIRIGEVARRAGIAASAIRYYEREGLIPRADRQGNARVYGPEILDRLALIELAKTAGFTVAETRQLVRGVSRRTSPGPRWHAMAKKKLIEVEERIAEAERMRAVLKLVMGCECPTFEQCTRAGC
ncbi:MAG: MerR family transcriptional regulator [Deltaproteobacteria bacterium]|nr:MerR family transcriptional regulator [Deltaproteobacteria bacterium]MBW2388958.1 MerR family transcriptional regulator [Deltaproteobacteria bacterium]MBW2725084.1 MerR family transcriptional regulator [Deltaproteobacteria bacterium]